MKLEEYTPVAKREAPKLCCDPEISFSKDAVFTIMLMQSEPDIPTRLDPDKRLAGCPLSKLLRNIDPDTLKKKDS
jgi:hypothetical protein